MKQTEGKKYKRLLKKVINYHSKWAISYSSIRREVTKDFLNRTEVETECTRQTTTGRCI